MEIKSLEKELNMSRWYNHRDHLGFIPRILLRNKSSELAPGFILLI